MKSLIYAVIFVILFNSVLFSHPHIFIENQTVFITGTNKIKGIKVIWKFDEIFSSSIIHDYDQNKDDRLDRAEVKVLQKEAFSNLKRFNYFSHLKINNKVIPVKKVISFNAGFKKSHLFYSFIIPINLKKNIKEYKIKFSVYDHTYFASIKYKKNSPVVVRGTGKKNCTYKILKNSKTYYSGMIRQDEIVFKFNRIVKK